MLPGIVIAVVGLGRQAHLTPPPPPTMPPMVHGYVYFDAGSAVLIGPFGCPFAPKARYS